MPWLIKMTYAHPERMVKMHGEDGVYGLARQPRSPTRPARKWEVETWWEELPSEEVANIAAELGHIVDVAECREPAWRPAWLVRFCERATTRPARATA